MLLLSAINHNLAWSAAGSVPSLSSNTATANAGFHTLSGQSDAELSELEEAIDSTFQSTWLLNRATVAMNIGGARDARAAGE